MESNFHVPLEELHVGRVLWNRETTDLTDASMQVEQQPSLLFKPSPNCKMAKRAVTQLRMAGLSQSQSNVTL